VYRNYTLPVVNGAAVANTSNTTASSKTLAVYGARNIEKAG